MKDDPTKEQWRIKAKANRMGLTIDHARVGRGISHFLETLARSLSGPGGWVVAYSALPGEPDLSPLLAGSSRLRMALTRTPDFGFDLTVHPSASELERHRYGFEQSAPTIDDSDIGVVLVPGLAFDMGGTRLGHGAGYYDRFLARLGPGVLKVGVTDGFIVSNLPRDAHDIAMTHLASEAGVMPI